MSRRRNSYSSNATAAAPKSRSVALVALSAEEEGMEMTDVMTHRTSSQGTDGNTSSNPLYDFWLKEPAAVPGYDDNELTVDEAKAAAEFRRRTLSNSEGDTNGATADSPSEPVRKGSATKTVRNVLVGNFFNSDGNEEEFQKRQQEQEAKEERARDLKAIAERGRQAKMQLADLEKKRQEEEEQRVKEADERKAKGMGKSKEGGLSLMERRRMEFDRQAEEQEKEQEKRLEEIRQKKAKEEADERKAKGMGKSKEGGLSLVERRRMEFDRQAEGQKKEQEKRLEEIRQKKAKEEEAARKREAEERKNRLNRARKQREEEERKAREEQERKEREAREKEEADAADAADAAALTAMMSAMDTQLRIDDEEKEITPAVQASPMPTPSPPAPAPAPAPAPPAPRLSDPPPPPPPARTSTASTSAPATASRPPGPSAEELELHNRKLAGMSGYLWKKGGSKRASDGSPLKMFTRRNWKRRFFLLDGPSGALCYYEKEDDAGVIPPLGSLPLTECIVQETKHKSYKHCVLVDAPGREGFKAAADTRSDLEEWCEAISLHTPNPVHLD